MISMSDDDSLVGGEGCLPLVNLKLHDAFYNMGTRKLKRGVGYVTALEYPVCDRTYHLVNNITALSVCYFA